MLLAQMTDLHITRPGGGTCGGSVDTGERLRLALEALGSLEPVPDALVLTGDLADTGDPAEYAELARLLAPVEMPVHLAIGNHDERQALLAGFDFPAEAQGRFLQYAVDTADARLLVLDSTSEAHHMGEYCPQRLVWLRRRLAEDRVRPTVLAVHHPPFDTGVAVFDGAGPGWADGLVEAAAEAPNVVSVICGHVHRNTQTVIGGALVSVCPATAHQTTLDLAPAPSAGHLFVEEPPAFQLHRIDERGCSAHTVTVGDWQPLVPVSAEMRERWPQADPYVVMARRPR